MSTALSLAMQISANTASLAASVRDVNAKLDSMGNAGKRAAADLGVLKTIEISRVFVSAITTAAGSFQSLVVGSASAVAAVDDLSKRTGVSASALQAYQFAADQSGVGLETFGRGIQKLTVNLGEAQTGNAAAIKSFTDLGLSVTELAGLSPQVAFEKVAAAIAELPNPAQQAAAAVSLFGKSGIDLVPVFQEGAGFLQQMREEAERLGTVLSQDQVSNLAALDDSIAKVSAAFRGLTNRVVAEFAPALRDAADSASTFLGTLDARELLGQVSRYFNVLKGTVEAAAAAFKLMAAILVPLAELVLPVVASTLGLIVDNLTGAAVGASTAAVAYGLYSAGAFTAAGATAALTTAIRGLLASTGIGLLVVLFGAVGAAAIEYALKAKQANEEVAASTEAATEQVEQTTDATKKATAAAQDLGKALETAFRVPADVTDQTLIQGVVEKAGSAFKQLAADIGRVDAIPQELIDSFQLLRQDIEAYNSGSNDAATGQEFIAQSAAKVLELTNKINEARAEERQRIDDVVDGVKRAQEFEKQLAADRERALERVGEQENNQLDEIARRTAEIEAARLASLRARNNEPLRVSDIRTSEGMSQFISLATGREDPAIAESRRQTAELEAMNRKLDAIRTEKAEIMGGA
jgi:hypothetical protein